MSCQLTEDIVVTDTDNSTLQSEASKHTELTDEAIYGKTNVTFSTFH